MTGRDQWAEWMLERRHGSDPELLRQQLALLAVVRDQVLTNAAIEPGQAVLDVGCGDGLIGFAAAEAVGPTGTVMFSDISDDLLDLCRDLATQHGLLDRCQFVQVPASCLAGIDDQSVDAVALRSVLIFEADKANRLLGISPRSTPRWPTVAVRTYQPLFQYSRQLRPRTGR